MPRPRQTDDGLTKFQRYRQQQRHRGMKQLRIWVPDPHRPEFAAEARRQGLSLRSRPEECEALDFIAAAVELPES
ncbi:antitoxin MazE family protein [Aureimonas altamirensis]|uniref:antitoxin MazE-like protein n=1 Tax=Aureimonas altamirensis TaxID=370622 RepID=UPI0020367395|nr:antitoxin MazE-like protein [Aureimonas altamirensis]MCM2503687.1 antitoxin MazE family protein [Aureimonas altamirensis]